MAFIKDGPDRKGVISIIEGEKKPNRVFSVKRFICDVIPQQTPEETEEVADLVLAALKAHQPHKKVSKKS